MSRRFWIVCLMLALLPLRGWAVASMTVPAVAAQAPAHVSEASVSDQATMPPCHEATGDAAGTSGHACNLCDLCHSAAADVGSATLPALPVPTLSPRPALARNTGRHAVDGLERPPRTIFA